MTCWRIDSAQCGWRRQAGYIVFGRMGRLHATQFAMDCRMNMFITCSKTTAVNFGWGRATVAFFESRQTPFYYSWVRVQRPSKSYRQPPLSLQTTIPLLYRLERREEL